MSSATTTSLTKIICMMMMGSMFNYLMMMLPHGQFFFSIGKLETLFLIRLGSLFAFLNVLGHNLGSINPSTQKNACASLISISRFTHTVNRFFFLLSPSGRCSVQEQSKSGLLEKKCANVK